MMIRDRERSDTHAHLGVILYAERRKKANTADAIERSV